jgi:hypothetical protein
MSCDTNAHLEDNLRRWQESGGPRRWVEARRGRWDHADWLTLLEDLQRSPYGPLDPDAVGRAVEEARVCRANLRRWERSGLARKWVAARRGRWDHADWVALLEELRRSPYWPLDPAAVGEVLEEFRPEWDNLHRWQESGAARAWLAARDGRWKTEDGTVLWDDLRRAGFWPVDPEAAEEVLRELAVEWDNLRRWQESGAPRAWVEAHAGHWGADDWHALMDELRRSAFWPLDPELVGRVLEERKLEWWNLDRWRASGLARHWVEAHQGDWGTAEWLELQANLARSEFWPVDAVSLGRVLEEVRAEWWNFRRWQRSGQPRRWAESRRGRWGADDERALVESLKQSRFWPLDLVAVRQFLERLRSAAVWKEDPAAGLQGMHGLTDLAAGGSGRLLRAEARLALPRPASRLPAESAPRLSETAPGAPSAEQDTESPPSGRSS